MSWKATSAAATADLTRRSWPFSTDPLPIGGCTTAPRVSSRIHPSAFEAAIAHGYAVECDVQLSSDGVPFIFHDDEFDRLTAAKGRSDARPIAEVQTLVLTGSANSEVPPRFTEFLTQIAGRTQLQIELKKQSDAAKTTALAAAVADALRGYTGPYTLESFDPNLLSRCAARA